MQYTKLCPHCRGWYDNTIPLPWQTVDLEGPDHPDVALEDLQEWHDWLENQLDNPANEWLDPEENYCARANAAQADAALGGEHLDNYRDALKEVEWRMQLRYPYWRRIFFPLENEEEDEEENFSDDEGLF